MGKVDDDGTIRVSSKAITRCFTGYCYLLSHPQSCGGSHFVWRRVESLQRVVTNLKSRQTNEQTWYKTAKRTANINQATITRIHQRNKIKQPQVERHSIYAPPLCICPRSPTQRLSCQTRKNKASNRSLKLSGSLSRVYSYTPCGPPYSTRGGWTECSDMPNGTRNS